jgi:alpha-1,6-mannosyltransferase
VLELLDAAARSADPWPLRLVGRGPLEETLRTRARRLGLEHRVSFRPPVRDAERLARRYAGARCVVLPGEHDSCGLLALEAAACGAPVAACATAPALRAVGRLGHQFVPGDPGDLDRAIADARAAEPDPEAAAALAWRHRWDRVFRVEAEALRELVG